MSTHRPTTAIACATCWHLGPVAGVYRGRVLYGCRLPTDQPRLVATDDRCGSYAVGVNGPQVNDGGKNE